MNEQLCQIWRRCAPPFFCYLRKTDGGGGHICAPPGRARVNTYKYQNQENQAHVCLCTNSSINCHFVCVLCNKQFDDDDDMITDQCMERILVKCQFASQILFGLGNAVFADFAECGLCVIKSCLKRLNHLICVSYGVYCWSNENRSLLLLVTWAKFNIFWWIWTIYFFFYDAEMLDVIRWVTRYNQNEIFSDKYVCCGWRQAKCSFLVIITDNLLIFNTFIPFPVGHISYLMQIFR